MKFITAEAIVGHVEMQSVTKLCNSNTLCEWLPFTAPVQVTLMYESPLEMAFPEPSPEAEVSLDFMYSFHAPAEHGTPYDRLLSATDYQPITLIR